MTKRFDIAAMGEGLVEFNQTKSGQPTYLQGFGGDTSNAAIAAARAGARTAYISAVGADTFGSLLRDLWQFSDVDIQYIAINKEAYTGLYFVTHAQSGHEFSYHRAGSAAALMTLSDAQCQSIAASKILHLSGISLAISNHAHRQCLRAMEVAKAAGTQISFDSNLRLKLWSLDAARDAMLPVIAQSDIFLPSLEDVTQLSGLTDPQAIVQWSHGLGAKTVVLKLGSQGVLSSDGQQCVHIPALPVKAIDATGAGDCFGGNLLARICLGDLLPQAVRYANAAAAIAVQSFGAVAPLPKPDAVYSLLDAYSQ